jgi:multiple sugar transport system substrate-binding protein
MSRSDVVVKGGFSEQSPHYSSNLVQTLYERIISMKKSIRSPLMLALLVTLVLSLTSIASAQDQITLEWWDYLGGGNDTEAIEDMIARYQAEHPNITIERTVIPFGDLKTRVIQAAATGTMPDIVIIDNPDHQSMAAQGAFADITDIVADWPDVEQYFEGPWASTVYQGRNYGVPFKSNATALFYNADLLAEAGYDSPPETWEELQEVAAALTEGDRYGFCFSGVATEEGTFTVLPFLWGNGSDIQTIGDEASIETLTFLNTLVNVDQSVPTSVLNLTQGDVNNLFMAGQCAMMINGPWQIPGIMENADVTFEWSVSGWPYNVEPTSILGGENFAIGAGADVEAAWEVISWAVQPDNLIPTLQINGQLPGRADAAADPYFTEEDPLRAVFAQQVSVAKPRAYGENYPQMSEEIMRMVQGVLTGAQTPEEAAAAAHDVIQPLLEPTEGG